MKLANTTLNTRTHLALVMLARILVALPLYITNTMALWATRHRTRKQLASLSERQRLDVGLTLEQAQEEAKKPFWQ